MKHADAQNYGRFKNLTFETFQRMAKDESLSQYEKIGFPDAYRRGKEERIFSDIREKLPTLGRRHQIVLDSGPGCSGLPKRLITLCEEQEHELLLIDGAEMLLLLPDNPAVTKIAGRFPNDCRDALMPYIGRVNTVLVYSVLHYIYVEANVFGFLDACLDLLSAGGELLLGDIPNVSKRNRFFSSDAGIAFHQRFTSSNDVPGVRFNVTEPNEIDDSVVISLLMRARASGSDAYVLPQAEDLPMANRREDILIRKP